MNTGPYAAVGGLDKQISQIRDLIDVPLTRPDLFQRFGSHHLTPTTNTFQPRLFPLRPQTASWSSASRSTWHGQDPPGACDRVLHRLVRRCRKRSGTIVRLPRRNRVQAESGFRRSPCQESVHHRFRRGGRLVPKTRRQPRRRGRKARGGNPADTDGWGAR